MIKGATFFAAAGLVTVAIMQLTPSFGQEFPGCTPEAETPQAIIDYFQKYDKPIPQAYCQSEAVPPIVSVEEEMPPLPDRNPGMDIQEEELQLPPQEEDKEEQPLDEEEIAPDAGWAPERHPLPPPIWPPERWRGLEIDVPGFHFELRFDKRKRRQ